MAPSFLRSVLARACSVAEIGARLPGAEGEVALRLTGDRELRRLNLRFMGEDHATDVLSFPSGGPDPHLGDIAISWPYAVRQAGAFGHSAESEVALLLVHGFLHLLGWDHESAAEEAEMNRVTLEALAAGGVQVGGGRLAGGMLGTGLAPASPREPSTAPAEGGVPF